MWLCVALCVSLWLCVALYSCVWLCVWLCVALCGSVWLCIALYTTYVVPMPVYSVICVYVCKDTALIMIVILLSVIDGDIVKCD